MPASPSTAVPPALAAPTAAPALRTSSASPAPPPQEPATQPLEPQPPPTAGGYSTRYIVVDNKWMYLFTKMFFV